jgi:Fic family protein
MNSLFDYVNENLTNKDMVYVLPHIAHYYLVYIHPYFDYNGRTSRMVSLCIHILMGSQFIPSGVSEAINQTRNKYYAALSETRNSKNDLTYFLKYIYRMSIDYILAYKNIEYITQNFANKGIDWSETEKAYFKKILISYSGKFSFETFKKIANLDISKVGLLKILNKFEEYGLLTGSRAKSKAKFFEINKDMLKYLPDNLRNVS